MSYLRKSKPQSAKVFASCASCPKLPVWRATLVQSAATFVALAAPAGIGPAALNLRMLTRRGVSATLAGATVALGADDPLLFGSRLAGQYATMRAAHDLSDAQLAELARMSVRASRAPEEVKAGILADVDAWLAAPAAS